MGQQHPRLTPALGLLACGGAVVVLLYALLLGFYIEATPRAIARSAKGHQIAPTAAIALVAGIVTLAARRRGWALAVGCVGAATAVVALVLAVLLPSG